MVIAMIRETLRMITKGDLTLNEIAQRFEISGDDLKTRIEMLEHMGYIVRNDVMGVGACDGCSFCPSSKTCSGISHNSGIEIITYQLTEKGKRVC